VLFKEGGALFIKLGIRGSKEFRFEELSIEGIIGRPTIDGFLSFGLVDFNLFSSWIEEKSRFIWNCLF
jgi:hypothetical protein